MEIDFAFLADAASIPPDGKLYVLGGGFDTIYAANFPMIHPSLTLVMRLMLHPTETSRGHQLQIELWDEHGKRLLDPFTAEFQAGPNPNDPTRPSTLLVPLQLNNLQIATPGDYEFHILADGRHLKTLPLYIQRAPTTPN